MRTAKFSLASVFSIILIFCLNIESISQNEVLILTKKRNGKVKTIKQGKRIKVFTNTGEVYKGKFTIKEDSLVIRGKSCVSINDVEIISKNSKGRKILGSLIVVFGGFISLTFGYGAIYAVVSGGGGPFLFSIALVSAISVPIFVVTKGVQMHTTGRKFKKTKWKYEIKKIGS
ncbi:MAG: hypothetical protein JEY97_13810 [Bacteroidales bacterium]|nr:hypothetical protein [Bacteroidales bacterium]